METAFPWLAGASLVIAGCVLTKARSLRATTLVGPALWAGLTWLCWMATAAIDCLTAISDEWTDQFWYFTVILAACPAVAVLGARRPVSRVWAVFVVLPLLLVFLWPTWTVWSASGPAERFVLETPMRIGYALVLVMGCGNYFGTRFTAPAILYGVGLYLLMRTFAEVSAEAMSQRLWATLTVTCSVGWAGLLSARSISEFPPHDRVWIAFRDAFGIVWAKRIMDRVNAEAEKEGWQARLDLAGLLWENEDQDDPTRATTLRQFERTLRWLLRRFVDDTWIDRHLSTASAVKGQ